MAGPKARSASSQKKYVPAIHVLVRDDKKDVDARHKAGHDEATGECTNT
jgi:hypothetical protein